MKFLSNTKYTTLYWLWAGLFVLTAGLGFVTGAQGAELLALRLAAVVFFLPPWAIVIKARQAGEYAHTRRVRLIALAWLVLALAMLCLNIASANWSETVGGALYTAMTVVCAPLVCGDFYALPLFLMAMLLFAAKNKPLMAK